MTSLIVQILLATIVSYKQMGEYISRRLGGSVWSTTQESCLGFPTRKMMLSEVSTV